MPSQRTLVVALLAVLALTAAATSTAQIPEKMNYQVMLTDDADQPLANESVQLEFRIYNVDAGGGSLWNETHNVMTNSIGVVSVVLGTYSPISIAFDGPLWLQVAVDGQVLSPRRELTSAAYALGVDAEWGDGHSLDAADGAPTDVVYVDAEGLVTVGTPVSAASEVKLAVSGERNQTAGHFLAKGDDVFGVGAFARCDSSGGVVGNSGTYSDYYPSNPTAITGVSGEIADAGLFVSNGIGKGIWAHASGTGDAILATAGGAGRSGYFDGGLGVEMVLQDSDTEYPVLGITNNETSWYGDCLWLTARDGVSAGTYTLYSRCYRGRAGYFVKSSYSDFSYVVYISSTAYDAAGLYVYGYIYSSSAMAHGVETSRGTEAVFSLSSPEVEMVSSGRGRLSAGVARIDFDRTFAESITKPEDLRITATPVGGWSALYIESIDADGFYLRSASGDADVEFHWSAVGRAKGHERRPEIVIPDRETEMELARQKETDMRSRRPATELPVRPPVVSAENQ